MAQVDFPGGPVPDHRWGRLLAAVVPGPEARIFLALGGVFVLLAVLIVLSADGALAERFWYLRFRGAEPPPPATAAAPEPPRVSAGAETQPRRIVVPRVPPIRRRTADAVRGTPASVPIAPRAPAGNPAAEERTSGQLTDADESAARAAQELGDLCYTAGRFDEAQAHYRAAARLFKRTATTGPPLWPRENSVTPDGWRR